MFCNAGSLFLTLLCKGSVSKIKLGGRTVCSYSVCLIPGFSQLLAGLSVQLYSGVQNKDKILLGASF